MSRLQADFALALAGLIWGFGFVAQKNALGHIGPFTFVAVRFLLSALVVLPLVARERSWEKFRGIVGHQGQRLSVIALCIAFASAVMLQQYGLLATTVTNTSFLTSLYVVMVPLVSWLLYRQKIIPTTLVAGGLSIFGIWLLAGGSFGHPLQGFGWGDGLVIGCAIGFAFQVPIMGHIANLLRTPFLLSFLQYATVGIIALMIALVFEPIDVHAITSAWMPILYGGIASGGIAYTLQAVAQQHTPSADTAIILSSESLFGAIGGMWLLDERLTPQGWWGCAAILSAIILVELGPMMMSRLARKI